jgi:hypothetical protein
MNLNKQSLSHWLKNVPQNEFPQGVTYEFHSHYIKLRDYLIDNVHKEVVISANLKDPNILLNDHGVEHINTVISRASYLVEGSNCGLEPFEVYVLLCCIELHDVGNILGRYKHELNIITVVKDAIVLVGRDTIETMLFKQIAETHGGKLANGNKDKISVLENKKALLRGTIRPRLIASILRLADELADDKTRANSTMLKNNSLPKGSEVFHAYAMCLESVSINHIEHKIEVSFHIPDNFLKRYFGKLDGNDVFLIDEIYERLIKMYHELKYCMRFCKGFIDLEKISVRIEFYNTEHLIHVFPRLEFEISESGYPSHSNDIFSICPELCKDGIKLNGDYYNTKIVNDEKPL